MEVSQQRYYEFQTQARGLLDAESLQANFEKRSKWYRSRLGGFLPRDADAAILDLPCGFGNILYFLRQQGYRNIIGYDLDPEQVRLARLLDLPAHQGDALSLVADAAETFDCIISVDFLEHISRDDAVMFLENCWRALRSGGVLIVRTPCADGPFGAHDAANDLTHQWSMTSNVLATILRMLKYEKVVILDERPQPYKLINLVRLLAFYPAVFVASAFFNALSVGAPKVWSRSMWGVGHKPQHGGGERTCNHHFCEELSPLRGR